MYSLIYSSIASAINHLLDQEPWARAKLVGHAGKVACVDTGLIAIRLEVMPDGMLRPAKEGNVENVVIRVKMADLPLIAQHRERAFSYVTVEGDADFANTISQLSQFLHWEIEEDLSKWVGDIAATRLVAGARFGIDTVKSTGQKLAENVAEYLLEENPMLMRPQAIADFSTEVAKLRDDVERLGKRLDRLEGSR